MAEQGFAVLILAAGKATRFKSEHSKMLHRLAGRPLGAYVLETALAAVPERILMIVGHEAEEVKKTFGRPGLEFIEQKEQLGTGHALLVARPELERMSSDAVVVLVGDAPLLHPQTLLALVEAHHKARAAATVLTTRLENPHGYGRIVRADGRVRAIVEEKVASPAQRRIREVNSGIMCFSRRELLEHLGTLTAENAQKEYLLTDLIEIFNRHRLKVTAYLVADAREVLGVNDRVELAQTERTLRRRKADTLMREGVTIVDPECTYIDAEVEVGRDTVIEPGVSLLGATRVGEGCLLRPYSTLSDSVLGDRVTVRPCCVISSSQIASDVVIGPFAHLRDGALIDATARIGNFVEVKKSRVGRGSKALHLTYLGDATLGDRVNIGAGTVTCNYDGEKKHPTTVEEGVFVGSGSMLVAPVRVGRNSYVAAGSTITEDVPPESLAVGRARQVNKEGWARQRESLKGTIKIGVRGAGSATIFDLSGSLTLGDPTDRLRAEIRPMIDAGRRNVVLNFAKVSYVDSAGMGALVAILKAVREANGELRLCGVQPRVEALLKTANLAQIFEISPDEAEAVASLSKQGRA
ncbi:MAG: bifunctional UDP-N-acetylglucosamine diphosphorylase/glucosamine-1-phosphate N-acetyltransferase GlmU [Acidobacteriia bacterium]|nr:bifunctional UDP-N-acetylglucosamine diphosphorylase/glucosamine-1-phosphate N-acetyltransferase GlmU [Terriglobia bacterium]